MADMDPSPDVASIRYRVRRSVLSGRVKVSGAKNSALRLLAASILSEEPVSLCNFPETILDAQVHIAMLRALGKVCTVAPGTVHITEPSELKNELRWNGRSIRNTLLILGALVARTGYGAVPLPGGCQIGERKYDLHELVLRSLGAEVWEHNGMLFAKAPRGLRGADIHLPIRSTGATENAILAGTLAQGVTRVWNPHVRPEILDLVRFLRSMGAQIEVFGQQHIEVHGVGKLSGAKHDVIPDNLEALTWLIGAVITDGDVEIEDFPFSALEIPLIHLRESGARFYRLDTGNAMIVRGGTPYPVEISTGPFPGINSDMQPLFALFAASAQGDSRIVDLRFPDRYGYAEEFRKLGVKALVEGNMIRVSGRGRQGLVGSRVRALDLRAGVALTLAGLVASGETIVEDAWQVERGYDRFIEKLRFLGADVEREFD